MLRKTQYGRVKKMNVSKGKENFSQRNNILDPHNSCNTTAMVMATSYMPVLWEKFINSGEYKKFLCYDQPEDRFRASMVEQGLDPVNHTELMIGYNFFMGGRYDYFDTRVDIKDLLSDLERGFPVVISGTFPGYPVVMEKPYGHIVVLVGFEDGHWIIDDPYGDTLNNWHGSGNDIKLSHRQFIDWMKPVGDDGVKWAHRFQIKEL
jgi:hypothetical protein